MEICLITVSLICFLLMVAIGLLLNTNTDLRRTNKRLVLQVGAWESKLKYEMHEQRLNKTRTDKRYEKLSLDLINKIELIQDIKKLIEESGL